jgi:hypothetical protein
MNNVCPTWASLAGTGSVEGVGAPATVDDEVVVDAGAPPAAVVGTVGCCARAGVELPANDSRPSAATKATRAAGTRSRLRITA